MRSLKLTFLLTLFLLAGCGNNVERTTLLVYTPHGRDLLRDFAQKYEAANPNVKVQFLDIGSREILERIRAERFHPQADIWFGASQITFQDAANENLLANYRPTWADKVSADSHDVNDFWYGTYETPEVIAYNSEVLTAETAPKDWDEVLTETWRDKILIRNPIPSDSMRVIFGAMIQRQTSTENGYEWLEKLDGNVKEYTSDGSLLMQKIARREGLISLWNMPDVVLFKQQKNLPVDYILPASGTPVVIDAIAVVKNAPNQREAQKFYEFVTTRENLIYAANKYYRLPVSRPDVEKSELPAWMQTDFKRMNVNWDDLRKNGSVYIKHWDNKIRGRNK
ncbi:MAG: extracellular solute-binding protein [Pyrinomonadaceae bacterium]|nr:extracellular solute-binding protein [Pyrinomonadaceae bacterium]